MALVSRGMRLRWMDDRTPKRLLGLWNGVLHLLLASNISTKAIQTHPTSHPAVSPPAARKRGHHSFGAIDAVEPSAATAAPTGHCRRRSSPSRSVPPSLSLSFFLARQLIRSLTCSSTYPYNAEVPAIKCVLPGLSTTDRYSGRVRY